LFLELWSDHIVIYCYWLKIYFIHFSQYWSSLCITLISPLEVFKCLLTIPSVIEFTLL
jgi:hypothetical protein